MSNYLDTDCYDGKILTVYMTVDEDGEVCGIYGDRGWAEENAYMDARDGDMPMAVREVEFRASTSKVVFRSSGRERAR